MDPDLDRLAIFAWLFLRGAGWLRRSIGALDGVAAALGFVGLFDNPILVWAGFPMLLGLVGLAFTPMARRGFR